MHSAGRINKYYFDNSITVETIVFISQNLVETGIICSLLASNSLQLNALGIINFILHKLVSIVYLSEK